MKLSPLLAAMVLCACGDTSLPSDQGNDTAPPDDLSVSREAATEKTAEAVLDRYYASAKQADFDMWIAQFTDDAMFYGTDATEAWPREEFAKGVEDGFAKGGGWDFEVLKRRITIGPSGDTAWFAELAHFANTDYTLRPTGVLVRDGDGTWKIAQLVMGVPFPNDIYEPFLNGLQGTKSGEEAERAAAGAVLSELHLAAHEGRLDDYIGVFADDAIFIGTDLTERWTVEELKAYAAPAFEDGHGWTYDLTERNIILSPMKNVAWFDEVLSNEKYGMTRGSGTLVRSFDGWKVTQYHLTFPIPNEIASDVVGLIKGQDAN